MTMVKMFESQDFTMMGFLFGIYQYFRQIHIPPVFIYLDQINANKYMNIV